MFCYFSYNCHILVKITYLLCFSQQKKNQVNHTQSLRFFFVFQKNYKQQFKINKNIFENMITKSKKQLQRLRIILKIAIVSSSKIKQSKLSIVHQAKNALNLTSTLININSFSFVKLKDIQNIKQQYQNQGKFKVLSKSCGFFMKQAWHDFNLDFTLFKNIHKTLESERSVQEKYLYRRIKIDLIKFGPAFLVFNIPFGLPFFYLYLKFFPRLIPSWMMIDSLHQKTLQSKEQRRKYAWEYYQKNFDKNVMLPYLQQAIFKENQSLEDLRRISCICYGDYLDGTQYLSQKSGVAFPNGFIFPKLSILLLKKQLENQLSHDYQIQSQLQKYHSFQQKLLYKLKRQIQKMPLF